MLRSLTLSLPFARLSGLVAFFAKECVMKIYRPFFALVVMLVSDLGCKKLGEGACENRNSTFKNTGVVQLKGHSIRITC
jgi:hypothetical protein